MDEKNYDICIVGGGMTGAALALGLAQLYNKKASADTSNVLNQSAKYKIALIEKHALQPFVASQKPDIRLSAINMHSVNLLKQIGAWQHIAKMRYKKYDTLSVWDADGALFGNQIKPTSFTASELKHQQLGYFVENRIIQLAIYDEIRTSYSATIDCFHECDITAINTQNGKVQINNKNKQISSIQANLIVGADGANSQVRNAANIATSGWQYSQRANAILIDCAQKVKSETWQAFYASGPRALLPMHNNYACLIWYDSFEQSHWIQNAKRNDLKQALIEHFPDLKSDFDIINVAGFGLTRMHAKQYGRDKTILIGDAAHTINPLAGQGVNLGFKDVTSLLSLIDKHGIDDLPLLVNQYEAARKAQNLLMMTSMDMLYKTFSSPSIPVKVLRDLGLAMADKAGPIKRQALKYAMGL